MFVSPQSFDAILSGKKTYECQVYSECLKNITVGTLLIITDGTRSQTAEIVKLSYFNNFGDAWFVLGESFIPSSIADIVLKEDAIKLYNEYSTDVEKNGVVAMKLKITQ